MRKIVSERKMEHKNWGVGCRVRSNDTGRHNMAARLREKASLTVYADIKRNMRETL